jgi:hypothetical protein
MQHAHNCRQWCSWSEKKNSCFLEVPIVEMIAPTCDALFRAKTRLPWASKLHTKHLWLPNKSMFKAYVQQNWGKWVTLVRVKISILDPNPDIRHAHDCKQVKTRSWETRDACFLQPWASRGNTRLAYECKNEIVNHPSQARLGSTGWRPFGLISWGPRSCKTSMRVTRQDGNRLETG